MEQVDKLLDSAALAQVDRVRIIHGHGMGILKKAIADLLKQNPHVEKFYVASQDEGGSGATIVGSSEESECGACPSFRNFERSPVASKKEN